MIREDYVSFEVAQLLKEKGFDELCYACYEYFESGVTLYKGWPVEYKGEPVHNTNERVKCPTLQMAMKWLREVHDIFIEIMIFDEEDRIGLSEDERYCWNIHYNSSGNIRPFSGKAKTPEEASGSAIKYCLENLI